MRRKEIVVKQELFRANHPAEREENQENTDPLEVIRKNHEDET